MGKTHSTQNKTHHTNAADTADTRDVASMDIDAALIAEGTAQLNKEIQVLEAWLAELESGSVESSQAQEARKSYSDMLVSRREMLETLQKQRPSET